LTAQFDAAEALLKEIQAETEAVKSAVYEQNERVDKVTKEVESVVVEMREGESKTRDEMREIRDEVENIREMLPKVEPAMSVIFTPLIYQHRWLRRTKRLRRSLSLSCNKNSNPSRLCCSVAGLLH
jgi:septal ring factor EnvC (AmiA/AmiB activator)